MAFRRRTRPLWRSFIDLAGFLIVLTATLYLMQRFDMIDLGTGPVEVVDGNSLRLNGTDIRLHGIDAPEYTQQCDDENGQPYPCGKQARSALRDLVRGKEVHCTSVETDRYGRAISRCKAGETDIGRTMVQQGWAIAYQDTPYTRDEAQARARKLGIWPAFSSDRRPTGRGNVPFRAMLAVLMKISVGLVLRERIELSTSSLPMTCSTTELPQPETCGSHATGHALAQPRGP